MPETMQDEVVSERAPATRAGSLAARPMMEETVAPDGATKAVRNGIEQDNAGDGQRKGRVFKESTQKLLEKFDAPESDDPDDAGLVDEDEGAEPDDPDDVGLVDDKTADATAAEPTDEPKDEEPSEIDEIRATATRLEERNKALLAELETARKTPKATRTPREDALVAAEAAYFDEGTVPALRKFLSVITGAAVDSKEVDAELAGLYVDLTAREVGVPLDQNQQALRDNARTRLLLARDKREKAEGTKKADVSNGADTVQWDSAAKYVDNLLTVKDESGTSMTDEYPMLMALAEHVDGYKPSEVIARALKQEFDAGTLDPNGSETKNIRIVAQKINAYYDAVAKKLDAARAKTKKPDTTTTSAKQKTASATGTEQRQSHGARTITNAAASRAPAKPPKTTERKQTQTNKELTRKDFPSEAAWKQHLLSKHFPKD